VQRMSGERVNGERERERRGWSALNQVVAVYSVAIDIHTNRILPSF